MDTRFVSLLVFCVLVTWCKADVPAEMLSFGGECRLRGEALDNALDLTDHGDTTSEGISRNDAYEYLRFRTRMWFKASPQPGLAMFFRLGNEYRFGRGANTSGMKDPESKVSLDNAWARISRRSVALTFGRMDLLYGEGFLIFDGTPADGSSSAWFDAVKLSLARPIGAVDFIFAKIDEEGFGGPSRDEDLVGVYGVRGKAETYLLHRTKRSSTGSLSGTVRSQGTTTAAGARIARQPSHGVSYAAEGAYQWGDVGSESRRGYGGYGRIGWRGAGRAGLGVECGGLYLSGDDPSTDRHEGWDGFYGEWPKYSELLVYTLYDNTTRVTPNEPGTWTNMAAFWLEAGVAVPGGGRLVARITPLRAAEKGTGPGSGTYRGLLVAARADARLAEGLQAQVLGEVFTPGDFYADDADVALYGRWQLTASF
ncbi:hypothetical protein JXA88_12675 [Candidatus Fermentibacteria bacterium]|nr:hypothetical protein [Candidatus Fermentibacteria bacterium]